jgi:hypothetical protein
VKLKGMMLDDDKKRWKRIAAGMGKSEAGTKKRAKELNLTTWVPPEVWNQNRYCNFICESSSGLSVPFQPPFSEWHRRADETVMGAATKARSRAYRINMIFLTFLGAVQATMLSGDIILHVGRSVPCRGRIYEEYEERVAHAAPE